MQKNWQALLKINGKTSVCQLPQSVYCDGLCVK